MNALDILYGREPMNKKLMSIKTAVLLPFIVIMAIIVSAFVMLWRADYNWLATEQGSKILNTMNTNTEERINSMLSEPQHINEMYSQSITREQMYNTDEMPALQSYTLDLIKKIRKDVPQISVI